MRLRELSQASGVSPAAIKFYLREGLLPPGSPTGRSRLADYHPDRHLHRLRLIRVLTDVGGLPLATVRAVLAAIDDQQHSVDELLGLAHASLALPAQLAGAADEIDDALAEVDDYLRRLGWGHSPAQQPARDTLAAALAALRQLGWQVDVTVFEPYAEAADRLATRELGTVPAETTPAEVVERAVVGTVVFESALVALRRLAHARHSARRFRNGGS